MKPWEKYQQAAGQAPAPAGGPWEKYQQAPAQADAPLSGTIGLPRAALGMPGFLGPAGPIIGNILDPSGGQYFQAPVPAPVEAGTIGAGRTFTRLGRGIEDLAQRVMGNDPRVAEIQAKEAEEAPLYDPLQDQYRAATLAGEVAPYLATAPLGAPAGLTGAIGLGAGMGALEHQPTIGGRAKAGAFGAAGGALGHTLGRIAGRALGGRASQLDDSAESIASRGEELGFRLTPGGRTGSSTARQIEASLESSPVSSAPFAAIRESNQETLNRIAAQALGLGDDVTRITSDKLGQAADDIGRQFDDALGGKAVVLDDAFAQQLDEVQNTYASTWGRGNKAVKVIEDAKEEMAKSGGEIAAERYKQLQTMLREEAQSAFKSDKADSALGRAIDSVKDALDDAASRSLSGDALSLFRDAQSKWKVMRQLDQALDPSTGNVSGKVLANTLNKKDVAGFRRGKVGSALYDAARFAKMFGQSIGDSGTATRQSITNMLKMAGIGGGGGVAVGTASDYVDPETGAILGLLSPLLLRGASGAYASKLAARGLMGPGSKLAKAGLEPVGRAARQSAPMLGGRIMSGAANTRNR